jgi:hypothetical protein
MAPYGVAATVALKNHRCSQSTHRVPARIRPEKRLVCTKSAPAQPFLHSIAAEIRRQSRNLKKRENHHKISLIMLDTRIAIVNFQGLPRRDPLKVAAIRQHASPKATQLLHCVFTHPSSLRIPDLGTVVRCTCGSRNGQTQMSSPGNRKRGTYLKVDPEN